MKNNLDAYRGEYPARASLLFQFVLGDIAAVDVVDPLTVQVTTARALAVVPVVPLLERTARHHRPRPSSTTPTTAPPT